MMRLSHQAPNVTLSSNSSQDITGGIQAQSPHRVRLFDTSIFHASAAAVGAGCSPR